MWHVSWINRTLLFTILLAAGLSAFAQDSPQPPPTDPPPQTDEAQDETPITGGVAYQPKEKEGERVRDPFKSPFELEEEERQAQAEEVKVDDEDRLVFNIAELELKGIYLRNGQYLAIFRVGDDYQWFPEGVKFKDGDLVNITDGAVVFHHYTGEDLTQKREVIKELHRGEEQP